MPTRGVLYVKWDRGFDCLLHRSIESLKHFHPDYPVHVATLPDGSNLLDKAKMFQLTPFDETLYLDSDTVVLDDLTYGFEQASRFGLAVSICECPWARRYTGLGACGDLTEYNTGVVFFTRRAQTVFDSWRHLATSIDSSLQDGKDRMPVNDQAAFARAIDETSYCPRVLPFNWNFRPYWHHSYFGPIKIWHSHVPIPQDVLAWNADQSRPGATIRFASLRRK